LFNVLGRILIDVLQKFRMAYIIREYNDFIIADLFRKQGAGNGENSRIMIEALGD